LACHRATAELPGFAAVLDTRKPRAAPIVRNLIDCTQSNSSRLFRTCRTGVDACIKRVETWEATIASVTTCRASPQARAGRDSWEPRRVGFWSGLGHDPIALAVTDAIAAGRLPAGSKLGEEELGRLFRCGRTRVRQALQRLAFASLVRLEPNRGAFVASPTLEEAQALYAARRLIEAEIVREATRHCTANDIRSLRAHCRKQQAARHDQSRFIRLLSEFHMLIAAIGGNTVLADILAQLTPRTALLQALYRPHAGGACAVEDHLRLIDMMTRGDPEAAAQAMHDHLNGSLAGLSLPPAATRPDLAIVLGHGSASKLARLKAAPSTRRRRRVDLA
jgi:DNA-binding GntR family transcriptional regulator